MANTQREFAGRRRHAAHESPWLLRLSLSLMCWWHGPSASHRAGGVRGRATAVALGLAASLAGAPAAAETLEEAMAAAYETNPTLRAARKELAAVNEQVPQELSNWRPRVTVEGSFGRERFEQESAFFTSQDTVTPWSTALELRQPLFRGGRTVNGVQRAENEVRAQRARLQTTEQDVLLRAVGAYMDVWRDTAVLQLTRNNEQVLQRQLEAAQDRFAVGEITRTDVAQSESRLSRATADRIAAEGDLSASRAVYQEVIGRPPGDLRQPPVPEGVPASREATVSLAKSNNPAVRASSFAEAAARGRARQVAGELLPTLEAVGRVTHTENSTSPQAQSDSAELLAELRVPLYQAGQVSSRVREARQVASQRRLQIVEARRSAEQQAISAWEDLQSARAQIVSIRDQVRAADIALEGVRQENRVGARTVLDVLDAEQELLDAQVSLVRAQRDEIVASYGVLSAIGRLTAAATGLPVSVYDVERPYQMVRDRWFGLSAPDDDPAQ